MFTNFATALFFGHAGHAGGLGWFQGLLHPITGLDHTVAMITVGVWAALLGGRAVLAVPVTFLASMVLGGLMGTSGVPFPWLEPSIAASVLILGLLVAVTAKAPTWVAAGVAGLVAVFHGFAHGAEMPSTASGFFYGSGFVLSTAALLTCGVLVGSLMKRVAPVTLGHVSGVAVCIVGVLLITNVI